MSVADFNDRDGKARFDARAPFRLIVGAFMALARWIFVRAGGVVGALSILGFFATMLAIDWLRPVHNWDTIAYLGVVARDWLGHADADVIHSFAYGTVQQTITPEAFAVLTENDAYRVRMYVDPQAFVSMLGMYDVKWLYTALVALLFPYFGYSAGFMINCGAALLMSMSLIGWMQSRHILHFGLAAPALLMVAGLPGFGMVDIPDFLTLALLVSSVLSLDRQRMFVGSSALVLAVLSRPDAAIFAGILLAVAWYFQDRRATVWALGSFAVVIGAYLFVTAGSSHPGWWPHVWFSTYQMQNDLTSFDPDFSIAVYATAVAWNLVRSALENSWLGMYIIVLGGWAFMHGRGLKFDRRKHVLVAALLTAVAVKFMIFPLHDGRVHVIFIIPAMFLFLAAIARPAGEGDPL